MNLELFVSTVKEYVRFSNQLPLKRIKTSIDLHIHDEAEYVAIQTRLILLRKYFSENKKNNVYIGNIVEEAKRILPDNKNYLDELMNKFLQIKKQSFEHTLSNGIKLNIYFRL